MPDIQIIDERRLTLPLGAKPDNAETEQIGKFIVSAAQEQIGKFIVSAAQDGYTLTNTKIVYGNDMRNERYPTGVVLTFRKS